MTADLDLRVYLSVPYAEKDEAKKHGARWDPVPKRWWIGRHDIAAHPAIHKWIIGNEVLAAKARAAEVFVDKEAAAKSRRNRSHAPRQSPRTDFSLADCSCPSPPWEHCEHTMSPVAQQPAASQILTEAHDLLPRVRRVLGCDVFTPWSKAHRSFEAGAV